MIGLIIITITYLFLRIENRNLSVIGFNKPLQRSTEFLIGLLVAALFVTSQFILKAHFSGFDWVLNPELSWDLVLESVRWNINSVLFEELLFRGYLLYKAIELFGRRKGCFLSAIAFGVYHWFSYGVLGNVVQMAYVFLLTGLFGLTLAFAFERTKSIFLPIALHLGWNLTTIFVFSNGPLGKQLLIPSVANPDQMKGYEQNIISLLIPAMFFALVLWIVLFGVKRYRNQEE